MNLAIKRALSVTLVGSMLLVVSFGMVKCAQSLPKDSKEADYRSATNLLPMGTGFHEVIPSTDHSVNHIIFEFRGQCYIKWGMHHAGVSSIACPKFPRVEYQGSDGEKYINQLQEKNRQGRK